MNKTLHSNIFIILLLAGVIAACNLKLELYDETPTPTVSPTETPIPANTPTESVPTASATPEFAPFCEQDLATVLPPSQCQIPAAEEGSTYCQEKKPYNLILINQSSTYKSLTKGFTCTDAGIKDDKQMLACSGPMATFFEVMVCDSACLIPTVAAKTTQCPQDYSYNNLQGCCTKELQQVNQSCTTLKFRTTSCVVNCDEYKKEARCKKNSFACEWDAQAEMCVLRK